MSTDRHELALTAARNMASKVADAVPDGLGKWGPAWSLVETPSRDFMDALERFELADPADEVEDQALRRDVYAAARRLLGRLEGRRRSVGRRGPARGALGPGHVS